MENIIEWVILAIAPILIMIIIVFLYIVYRQNRLSKQLKLCVEDHLNLKPFLEKISVRRLNLYASTVEKVSSHKDILLPSRLGIDHLWIKALEKNPNSKNIKRVLRFCVENGLYSAFKSCLQKEKLQPIFLNYIQEQKSEVILNALSHNSFLDIFDGKSAALLMDKHLEEISMMAQSSSPKDRWFAYIILASLEDAHAHGDCKWGGFKDHHFMIRSMLLNQVNSTKSDHYFEIIYSLLLNDTEKSIRKNVKKIILDDYSDQYHPQFNELSLGQQIHLAENFSIELEEDKKIAFDLILSNNLELRQLAVNFLNSTDALKKLILSVDINDPSRLKHSYKLLKNALSVGSDSFFAVLKASRNSGTLMCGALLLLDSGDRRYIRDLAEAVFFLRKEGELDPISSELYIKTLELLQVRGDEPAWEEMKKELLELRYDKEISGLIMGYIPVEADIIFCDIILALLNNPKIENREALLKLCEKMPQEKILQRMLQILKSAKEVKWQVRMNAVEYLKNKNIQLCFQYTMENLDLFPEDVCGEVIQQLFSYAPEIFTLILDDLVLKEDSRTMIRLLKFLYLCEDPSYYGKVKKELENSSSDIRLAAIDALYLFHKPGYFDLIEPLLNDNEKGVRLLVAKKMALSANNKQIETVRSIVMDENELQIVKKALFTGLGFSENKISSRIIIEGISKTPYLMDHALTSLLKKDLPDTASILIELFSEVEVVGQKLICQYFKNKGMEQQNFLLELLKESSNYHFNNSLQAILYRTGFIDKTIIKLKYKSSELRISALNKLLIIDTYPAHKGILLAARDNNKAIRKVAFEKIETMMKRETEAIDALKADSSRMVQKNINWIINKIEKNGRKIK